MRRREFLGILASAASWPVAAQAQQPFRIKRLAIVHPAETTRNMASDGSSRFAAFFKELSGLGYVEGQNLRVERYSGQGRTDRYPELAQQVISARPDVIFCTSLRLALNFKKATTTIPVVALTADPILGGLVPSLARPDGNITGVSTDAGAAIWGKRLELLTEMTNKSDRVRYICTQLHWDQPLGAAATIREAARERNISLESAILGKTLDYAEYGRVFAAMKLDQVNASLISDEGEHIVHVRTIVEHATESHIPAIYPFREYAVLGGLAAYS